MSPRRLPLHDEHTALGARMVESEGWLLPLEFTGAFAEYRAHRKRSVVWDASNLGSIRVTGPGAAEVVQRTFTNDLRRLRAGRSQYSLLLSDADGGVVDDLMVWWVRGDLLVLTPSRPRAVLGALRAEHDRDPSLPCVIEDVSSGRVLLALQGARARERMAELSPAASSMALFEVCEVEIEGRAAVVSTTGFGGRAGFEIDLPAATARTVYRRLVAAGATPAGLAMRETHRVEAGIPRYGFEIGPWVTPLEAGCSRAVALGTEFVGRAALAARSELGPRKVLRTVVMSSRQAPAAGSEVRRGGAVVGRVTSGNYSFRLHRGLGLGFVSPEVAVGSTVTVRTPRGEVTGEIGPVPVDTGVQG